MDNDRQKEAAIKSAICNLLTSRSKTASARFIAQENCHAYMVKPTEQTGEQLFLMTIFASGDANKNLLFDRILNELSEIGLKRTPRGNSFTLNSLLLAAAPTGDICMAEFREIEAAFMLGHA